MATWQVRPKRDLAIVSVPSRQYTDEQRIYGDERFMTVAQWEEILSPASEIVGKFGFHHVPSDEQRRLAPSDMDKYQFLAFVLSPRRAGRR